MCVSVLPLFRVHIPQSSITNIIRLHIILLFRCHIFVSMAQFRMNKWKVHLWRIRIRLRLRLRLPEGKGHQTQHKNMSNTFELKLSLMIGCNRRCRFCLPLEHVAHMNRPEPVHVWNMFEYLDSDSDVLNFTVWLKHLHFFSPLLVQTMVSHWRSLVIMWARSVNTGPPKTCCMFSTASMWMVVLATQHMITVTTLGAVGLVYYQPLLSQTKILKMCLNMSVMVLDCPIMSTWFHLTF